MPTPSLLIEIATRHAIHLEGVKTGYAREFERFLVAMEEDLLSRLAKVDDPASLTARRLQRLLDAVQTTLDDGFRDYEKVFRQQLRELGAYESEFELKALQRVVEADFALPSPAQLYAAAFTQPLSVEGPDGGLLLGGFYRTWTERATQRVVNAIRLGVAQGQATPDIVRRIRGTRAAGYKDGLIDATRRTVTQMVRTSAQHVAVQAREAVWQANADIVAKVEWVSVLDRRTSAICRGLDGRQFPVKKGPRPPAHVACRSVVVPVLKGKLRLLQDGGEQFSRGEDGVKFVSANLEYYDWLKTQSPAFQDDVIGPMRGKLLRDGGLTAERFRELQLDKTFRERTLDEMRALEPLAFEAAGI